MGLSTVDAFKHIHVDGCVTLDDAQLKKLQKVLFGILLDIISVCQKHNIRYYLSGGTALGAVRHQGFIPWDDDVDLIMERSEYERFLSVAKDELSDKYEIQHPTTVENYWSPFIKVRQLKGDFTFRQSHISHLTENNGPYIDIFPMEFVPEKMNFKIKKTGFLIRFYRGMLSYKLGLRKPPHFYGKMLKFVSNFYSDSRHREYIRSFSVCLLVSQVQ